MIHLRRPSCQICFYRRLLYGQLVCDHC
jgi:hypothetical protein